MFRLLSASLTRLDDGSLIGAETCYLHRCKFVVINSCVGRLFGLHFYSIYYTQASNYHLQVPMSRNMEALTSQNPLGPIGL
jgi:hypothetical protein